MKLKISPRFNIFIAIGMHCSGCGEKFRAEMSLSPKIFEATKAVTADIDLAVQHLLNSECPDCKDTTNTKTVAKIE